jgi:UDP-glucuronate 4-epimerase
MTRILVTGAAGFIGHWTALTLAERGDRVVGLDNFNSYYDPKLKKARARRLEGRIERMVPGDVTDGVLIGQILKKHKIQAVCHLAAQAGVRYSIKNPFAYEVANNVGTLTLLEQCKKAGIRRFVYASSSSVYGGNTKIPFSVEDPVDRPISLYAATKRYNELIAYTYHHLFGFHCTGLRFFTVYGPWGRPDMALFKFTKAILEGTPVDVYNRGKMQRDFTYVSDIVDGVVASIDKNYPYEIFNLGNSKSVQLNYFISCVEKELGKKAKKKLLPMQPGDVPSTFADIRKSTKMLGFKPRVSIEEGIHNFVQWYRQYYL